MSWSAKLWCLAFFAALNLIITGCAAGRPWPTTVPAQADQRFLRQELAVRSVDILPVDVQLWTHAGSAEEAAGQFMAVAGGAVTAELAQRGYQVTAQMDWHGNYVGYTGEPRPAMAPEATEATAYSLSGYGRAVAEQGTLLVPHLPHRLGAATGSDATLYVGGWAYIGNDDQDSTGDKIAKGIAIALFAVVIIAIVVAVAKGSGGRGGGGGGSVSSGGGKVIQASASGAARAAGSGGAGVVRTAGRAIGGAIRPVARGLARGSLEVMRGLAHSADALSRTGTHIDIYAGRPDYFESDAAPKKGRSEMYIEMTLIDNVSGVVLWHAREQFPANATRQKDVKKVFSRMLATLPAH